MFVILLVLIVVVDQDALAINSSVLQIVAHNTKYYSKYYSLVGQDRWSRVNLDYGEITLFLPIDEAFRNYNRNIHHLLPGYYIASRAVSLKHLTNAFLSTVFLEYPPLWVTSVDGNIYINNALLLPDLSNRSAIASATSKGPKVQYLHVIDQVLDPVIKRNPPRGLFNPSALHLINHPEAFNVHPFTTSLFHRKVVEYQQEKLFLHFWSVTPGTFFIPIDSPEGRLWDNIDGDVIVGHVVPSRVLFVRATPRDVPYATLIGDDYHEVVIMFANVEDKLMIKAYMLLKNSTIPVGEVGSEVVYPNIPVRNGVVHLIRTPLMTTRQISLATSTHCSSLLHKFASDPTLSLTFDLAHTVGLLQNLSEEETQQFVLFAPRNRAWERVRNNLNLTPSFLHDFLLKFGKYVLGRHVAFTNLTLTMDKLRKLSKDPDAADVQLQTAEGEMMVGVGRVEDVDYIFWLDKVIKVYRPDYGCNHGVLHVIDDVFVTEQDFKLDDLTGLPLGPFKLQDYINLSLETKTTND